MPRLSQVIINDGNEIKNEITPESSKNNSFSSKLKLFWDFENILKIERCFDLVLKFIIVVFIGVILWKQISFVNNIITSIGSTKFKISDATIQIFITGTIIEFILGVKIIINSLFPEGDRKNSLDFMQGKKSKDAQPETSQDS